MSDKIREEQHTPVMLKEVLENLKPHNNGVYIDCTFGAGGYTQAILDSSDCVVIACDQDPEVLPFVENIKQRFKDRFIFIQNNFAYLREIVTSLGFERVDGIIFDLGVSSMQLDNTHRGFSFLKDAELDMRMSQSGMKAQEWVNTASEKDIADVIYKYGDEHYAKKIASQIINTRKISPIITTSQLATLVREVIKKPTSYKIDKATKTFQAIRIYINQELEALELGLKAAFDLLNIDGKLVVVSFHSNEDRIVKNYIKSLAVPKTARSKYTRRSSEFIIGYDNKFFMQEPTREEVNRNPRSRSAKLRVATKIEEHL